jgi:hypothetical protein
MSHPVRVRHLSHLPLLLLLGWLGGSRPDQDAELCSYVHPPGPLSDASVLRAAAAADKAAARAGHPHTRFLVAMRSIHIGSTWLTGLLRAHPDVSSAAREWFKPYRCCIKPKLGPPSAPHVNASAAPAAPPADPRLLIPGRNKALTAMGITHCNRSPEEASPFWEATLSKWFERTERAAGASIGPRASGFKNQLPLDLTAPPWDGRARALGGRCTPLLEPEQRQHETRLWEVLRRLRVRVVCLHRANAVAHVLSNELSKKGRRHNESALAALDPALVAEDMAEERRFRAVCVRGSARVAAYWLGYEDLYLGHTQDHFDRLQAFLGLEPIPTKRAAGEHKRAPRNISTRIANVAQLRALGGLVGRMLEPSFGTRSPLPPGAPSAHGSEPLQPSQPGGDPCAGLPSAAPARGRTP